MPFFGLTPNCHVYLIGINFPGRFTHPKGGFNERGYNTLFLKLTVIPLQALRILCMCNVITHITKKLSSHGDELK